MRSAVRASQTAAITAAARRRSWRDSSIGGAGATRPAGIGLIALGRDGSWNKRCHTHHRQLRHTLRTWKTMIPRQSFAGVRLEKTEQRYRQKRGPIPVPLLAQARVPAVGESPYPARFRRPNRPPHVTRDSLTEKTLWFGRKPLRGTGDRPTNGHLRAGVKGSQKGLRATRICRNLTGSRVANLPCRSTACNGSSPSGFAPRRSSASTQIRLHMHPEPSQRALAITLKVCGSSSVRRAHTCLASEIVDSPSQVLSFRVIRSGEYAVGYDQEAGS